MKNHFFICITFIALIFIIFPVEKIQAYQYKHFIINGGILQQQLPLDHSYGHFLKSRYNIDQLNMKGSNVSLVYIFQCDSLFFSKTLNDLFIKDTFGIGFEYNKLNTSFSYNSLNNDELTNSLFLTQQIISLHYFISFLELKFGVGINQLHRDFYGYRDIDILAENIDRNKGLDSSTTIGKLAMFELKASFFLNEESAFPISLNFGVRYTYAPHNIKFTDSRPALDEAGVPISSYFNLGGLAWLLNTSIGF